MRADEMAGGQVQAERFTAQLLAGQPARDPAAVAGRLLAIQSQDPRGARLAIRARTAGLTAADVDRAFTQDRALLITWLNRGTLHLIRSADYWWLHRLTAKPQFQLGCLRILARLGISASAAEAGVEVARKALAADGPQTSAQLAGRLAAAGVPAAGGAVLHVLMLASLRGLVVRGPMAGTQHAYALVADWLGKPPRELDRDAALSELARRYLAGHGPAFDRDLAKWAGLPLGQVRRGLTAIAAELRDRPDGLAELAAGYPREVSVPAPRLLGAFDPVLLGWASREPVLGTQRAIVTANGLFRPFALVDGKAAGTWAWTGGQVVLDRFGELAAQARTALAADARDVRRFLTGPASLASAAGARQPEIAGAEPEAGPDHDEIARPS